MFAVCRLEVTQRESIRQYVDTELVLGKGNFSTESVKTKLRLGRPQSALSEALKDINCQEKCSVCQRNFNIDCKEARSKFEIHTKNCERKQEINGYSLEENLGDSHEDNLGDNLGDNLEDNPEDNLGDVVEDIELQTAVPLSSGSARKKLKPCGASEPDQTRGVVTREEAEAGPRRTSLRFACEECNQKLNSRYGLYLHKRRKHKMNKNIHKDEKEDTQAQRESIEIGSEEPAMDISGCNAEDKMINCLLEDSDDEDDMQIISEHIITKYHDPKIKIEPEDGDDVAQKESEGEESSVATKLRTRSAFFAEHQQLFSACSDEEATKFSKDLKFLPGWKVKTMDVRRKTGEIQKISHFLSPEHIQLFNGISVIEYLRVTGKPQLTIELAIKKMKLTPKTFQDYKKNYLDKPLTF